ncbi:hypothetical protein A3L09_02945 [Thermococcus profundus]|uniref:DUF835 domain-containing protein n=1 Tax=Thermococcus profundus TaxID=49899 RepID=A0A2Z2M7C5_THEPR|nr:DUF835 domain-containing protein [Thermococcus profundus]ASJ02290.1 hypothetical protein A3L09_02945 [Thermococcus profundus]
MVQVFKVSNVRGATGEGEVGSSFIYPNQLVGFLESRLSQGVPVFLITRDYPLLLQRFWDEGSLLKAVWITTIEHPHAVHPRDLHKIEAAVIRDTSIRKSDVVLDGFEYLMLENGLIPALKFVSKVRDITLVNGTRFYVVLSDALTERERALLKRSMGIL